MFLFIYAAGLLLAFLFNSKEEVVPVTYKYMEKRAASDTTGIRLDSAQFYLDILKMNEKFMGIEPEPDKC
jgi:hypothetical protein